MHPLSTDQIRDKYLEFFREHGHAVIQGASLIPENDPTVLFTTAGMHPLVPYLLGEKHPAGKRLTNVQRCIRTQDIDEVGDGAHLTMFEMLGRWSLGDYFKDGAIQMSFEFMTQALGIPPSMFAVTCFVGDKDATKDMESASLWKKMGVAEDRIGYLPKAKNWWGPAGKTGPCGPDTEMFFWWGNSALPPPGSNPANDEANWIEIGNDVLMQYEKREDGTFVPLKQQNVDEGLGLDRLAYVLQRSQGARDVYETDHMRPIVEEVDGMLGRVLESSEAKADPAQKAFMVRHVRIITDHLRAATFIIADGIKPSNVDQGYVLRKLIRRAIRSAHKLGYKEGSFTSAIAHVVVEEYRGFYPFLQTAEVEIQTTLKQEEEQFRRTLKEGMKHAEREMEKLPTGATVPGVVAFHLYDTYGFPLELTKEIAAEGNRKVDEESFQQSFEQHQQKSRAGAEKRFAGGLADHSAETTKLHTATHLLNAALRKILGEHVQQKGSNITTERLRFDFNHPEKMTKEQIEMVEALVNQAITQDLPVRYHLTTVEGAKNEGAIGVFDSRYGSEVKVYVMGTGDEAFSKEICGGPHVAHTGMLGSFKIQKEESSSSGVRRIKAVVSGGPAEIEVAGEGN